MQYKLSAHAYKRFKERVNAKRSKSQAEMWVQHAIEHSVLLNTQMKVKKFDATKDTNS